MEILPPPDPLAQLDNCIRAHDGTGATPEEREMLVSSLAGNPEEKSQDTLWRLWGYWKTEHKAGRKPSVREFIGKAARRVM